MIRTSRLVLRQWTETDREPLAAMHADQIVMDDYGGPLSRAESDAKLHRYATRITARGFGRWLVEDQAGRFLGYAGVAEGFAKHPLGRHFEVGWRLVQAAWGNGYATEAARAALHDAFVRSDADEILSYTGPDNLRSQAVMRRLGLRRDSSRDFTARYDNIPAWRGLTWVADRAWLSATTQSP